MSRSIGTILIILLLATRVAAEDRMYGRLTQIDAASIWIRSRFRPRVSFTITPATMFYCRHERIPSNLLRMGDDVMVKFKVQKHAWVADEVRINPRKKVCSVRTASAGH